MIVTHATLRGLLENPRLVRAHIDRRDRHRNAAAIENVEHRDVAQDRIERIPECLVALPDVAAASERAIDCTHQPLDPVREDRRAVLAVERNDLVHWHADGCCAADDRARARADHQVEAEPEVEGAGTLPRGILSEQIV